MLNYYISAESVVFNNFVVNLSVSLQFLRKKSTIIEYISYFCKRKVFTNQISEMIEQIKNVLISIIIAIIAYLKPIEGELESLFLVFFLNFLFGYLSGMVKGEDFSLKKALTCIGHATIFFILCGAVYLIGRLKGQMNGAIQCVSFITYLVIYFYSLNILRNCKIIFKENTPPWYVADTLYFILRFKFIEHIPYLKDYLDTSKKTSELNSVAS